jgi:dTDP-4-dehydrorhamnose 3,5-epimerase
MRFAQLTIAGAFRIGIQRTEDQRGFFARTFCAQEFTAAGLPTSFVQASVSFNARRATVRGMHFQWPPSLEGKLVRCTRGALIDVLLDLRPESPTYLRHDSVRLDDDSRDAVYIPPGIAHGFQTLADGTELYYQMTDVHAPSFAAGVRWNDPRFGIAWPLEGDIVISERDAAYPDFDRAAFEAELRRRSMAPTPA